MQEARPFAQVRIRELELNNFDYPVKNLFHPAVTLLHDGRWMASMQDISNSDFYGEPLYAVSADRGATWSRAAAVEALRHSHRPGTPEDFVEGVADPRIFTLQDGSVIMLGCSNFYLGSSRANADARNLDKIPAARSYYAIWSPETQVWGARHELEVPGWGERNLAAACIQAQTIGADQIIVPAYVDSDENDPQSGHPKRAGVMSILFRHAGGKLEFVGKSRILNLAVKRGLMEPSVVQLPDGSFAMTIRAEDGNMYCAFAPDGLAWSEPEPWRWEDGSEIRTDSTQQHWIRLGSHVFLVYTRFDGSNYPEPFRYRAPLYFAEAVPGEARLIRASEQVVFPRMKRNNIEYRYGNFHCTPLGENAALITDAAYYAEVVGPNQHRNVSTVVKAAEVTLA